MHNKTRNVNKGSKLGYFWFHVDFKNDFYTVFLLTPVDNNTVSYAKALKQAENQASVYLSVENITLKSHGVERNSTIAVQQTRFVSHKTFGEGVFVIQHQR